MKFTYKELIIYAVLALIIVVAVAYYASSYFNSNVSVSVRMVQLGSVPQTLYPYEGASLRAYVNNTGSTEISGLVLETYVNGAQMNVYTLTLPPHTGVPVNITYVYPSSGTYQFQAVVDPGHLLSIVNRSAASASLTYSVAPTQSPDIYLSVPNANVVSTQTASFGEYGVAQALFIKTQYIKSIFNNVFGMNNMVLLSTFEDLSKYMAAVNGAYVTYANSSAAYSAWLQGPFNATALIPIVKSFSIATVPIMNGTGFYAALNRTTSLCAYYSGGWTKLLEYYNASSPGTCTGIAGSTYNPTESNVLVNALKADSTLQAYQQKFIYSNSTDIGSLLSYHNNTITATRLFKNNYGFFAGYISRNKPPLNFSAMNLTCRGKILSYKGESLCSASFYPLNTTAYPNVVLVNSTELNKNYTITLYSLVNGSFAQGAHNSATQLVGYLNVTGINAQWKSLYPDICGFFNATVLGCSVVNFNHYNNNFTMRLTNNLTKQIKLGSVSCYVPGFQFNTSVQKTLAPGANIIINTTCSGLVLAIIANQNVYNLTANYTINNVVHGLNGSLVLFS
jgi:hypothetical protein